MKILFVIFLIFTALLPERIDAASAASNGGATEAHSASAAQPASASSSHGPSTNGLPPTPRDLSVSVNKSLVIDHAGGIRRISVTNPDIAEAVAVSTTELLVNGKSSGDTSLILWDTNGARTNYDIHVTSDSRMDLVRQELAHEVGPNVRVSLEGANVFLNGTVAEPVLADRAVSIAASLGKVINLLRVVTPPGPPQILLKVRFANVSRTVSSQLGFNLFSGNSKGYANSTTGQYGTPPSNVSTGNQGGPSLSDLLNIFFYRPDLNLGATIQALEAKSLAQTLAEPNLLTVSGRPASFLAGGEFPFPTIQGGASGVGQITVEFKEYGIRLNFLPIVTPRGTIQLDVTPEVSSLDYTNGLTVSGYTVPGLATRRVQTSVELQNGQSLVIAGLLDNELSHQLDKMPGIANIPVLGKLFQSRSLSKNDDELLVLVTPQIVEPIPGGQKPPEVKMPMPFLPEGAAAAPQSPPSADPSRILHSVDTLPIEQWKSLQTATQTHDTGPSKPPQLMVVQPAPLTPVSTTPTQTQPDSNHE